MSMCVSSLEYSGEELAFQSVMRKACFSGVSGGEPSLSGVSGVLWSILRLLLVLRVTRTLEVRMEADGAPMFSQGFF